MYSAILRQTTQEVMDVMFSKIYSSTLMNYSGTIALLFHLNCLSLQQTNVLTATL